MDSYENIDGGSMRVKGRGGIIMVSRMTFEITREILAKKKEEIKILLEHSYAQKNLSFFSRQRKLSSW